MPSWHLLLSSGRHEGPVSVAKLKYMVQDYHINPWTVKVRTDEKEEWKHLSEVDSDDLSELCRIQDERFKEAFEVTFRLKKETMPLLILPNDTIGEVKARFADRHQFPKHRNRIFKNGGPLSDVKSVIDAKIQPGEMLQIFPLPESTPDPELLLHYKLQQQKEFEEQLNMLIALVGQARDTCEIALREANGDVAAAAEGMLAKRETLLQEAKERAQILGEPMLDEETIIKEIDQEATETIQSGKMEGARYHFTDFSEIETLKKVVDEKNESGNKNEAKKLTEQLQLKGIKDAMGQFGSARLSTGRRSGRRSPIRRSTSTARRSTGRPITGRLMTGRASSRRSSSRRSSKEDPLIRNKDDLVDVVEEETEIPKVNLAELESEVRNVLVGGSMKELSLDQLHRPNAGIVEEMRADDDFLTDQFLATSQKEKLGESIRKEEWVEEGVTSQTIARLQLGDLDKIEQILQVKLYSGIQWNEPALELAETFLIQNEAAKFGEMYFETSKDEDKQKKKKKKKAAKKKTKGKEEAEVDEDKMLDSSKTKRGKSAHYGTQFLPTTFGFILKRNIEKQELTMGLVTFFHDGMTLDEKIETARRLFEVDILSWLHQICAALAHLHSKGFSHDDICGENVMLVPRGRNKDGTCRNVAVLTGLHNACRVTISEEEKQIFMQWKQKGLRGMSDSDSDETSASGNEESVITTDEKEESRMQFWDSKTCKDDVWDLGCLLLKMATKGKFYPQPADQNTMLPTQIFERIPSRFGTVVNETCHQIFVLKWTKRPTAESVWRDLDESVYQGRHIPPPEITKEEQQIGQKAKERLKHLRRMNTLKAKEEMERLQKEEEARRKKVEDGQKMAQERNRLRKKKQWWDALGEEGRAMRLKRVEARKENAVKRAHRRRAIQAALVHLWKPEELGRWAMDLINQSEDIPEQDDRALLGLIFSDALVNYKVSGAKFISIYEKAINDYSNELLRMQGTFIDLEAMSMEERRQEGLVRNFMKSKKVRKLLTRTVEDAQETIYRRKAIEKLHKAADEEEESVEPEEGHSKLKNKRKRQSKKKGGRRAVKGAQKEAENTEKVDEVVPEETCAEEEEEQEINYFQVLGKCLMLGYDRHNYLVQEGRILAAARLQGWARGLWTKQKVTEIWERADKCAEEDIRRKKEEEDMLKKKEEEDRIAAIVPDALIDVYLIEARAVVFSFCHALRFILAQSEMKAVLALECSLNKNTKTPEKETTQHISGTIDLRLVLHQDPSAKQKVIFGIEGLEPGRRYLLRATASSVLIMKLLKLAQERKSDYEKRFRTGKLQGIGREYLIELALQRQVFLEGHFITTAPDKPAQVKELSSKVISTRSAAATMPLNLSQTIRKESSLTARSRVDRPTLSTARPQVERPKSGGSEHHFLVLLEWDVPDDHRSPIKEFAIQRKFPGRKWCTIKSTQLCSYTDIPMNFLEDTTELALGPIKYRVCARNACGKGKYSKATAVTLQYPGGLSLHEPSGDTRPTSKQRDSFAGLYAAPGILINPPFSPVLSSAKKRELCINQNIHAATRMKLQNIQDREHPLHQPPLLQELPIILPPQINTDTAKKKGGRVQFLQGFEGKQRIGSDVSKQDVSILNKEHDSEEQASVCLTGQIFHQALPINLNANTRRKKLKQSLKVQRRIISSQSR